jgi:hypothetical protein
LKNSYFKSAMPWFRNDFCGRGSARAHKNHYNAATPLSVESIDLERGLAVMARYQGVPLGSVLKLDFVGALPPQNQAFRRVLKHALGIVDASLVALAERLHIPKILTLDRRHFSLVQPEGISYSELLPLV